MTIPDLDPPRSWLFAPGHDEKLLSKVFDVGADIVLLDLEDAVPAELKTGARDLVAAVAAQRACWVRVNRARTELCERDLAAVAGSVSGIRIPKVESAADVAWVAERAPGLPLDCTIESARGVLAGFEVASAPACTLLSFGGLDLAADLETGMAKLYASEVCIKASLEAMRIHGGYGYSTEYEVERFYRDAPLMAIGEGTNDILRTVIARQLVRDDHS